MMQYLCQRIRQLSKKSSLFFYSSHTFHSIPLYTSLYCLILSYALTLLPVPVQDILCIQNLFYPFNIIKTNFSKHFTCLQRKRQYQNSIRKITSTLLLTKIAILFPSASTPRNVSDMSYRLFLLAYLHLLFPTQNTPNSMYLLPHIY